MSHAVVTKFKYSGQRTLGSALWFIWLLVPSRLRTHGYRLLLRYSTPTSSTFVSILPFGLYVKHGGDEIVDEALVTQFVAFNTSIPVPTILDLVSEVGDSGPRSMILTTRVPGRTMGEAGVSPRTMRAEQVALFVEIMGNWFAQLRALEQPPDFVPSICGFSGASFSSYRLDADHPLGPFKAEEISMHTRSAGFPSSTTPRRGPWPLVFAKSATASASRTVISRR